MNIGLTLCEVAIAVALLGAVAASVVRERWAPATLAVFGCVAASVSLASAVAALVQGSSGDRLLWTLPLLGPLAIGTTGVASLFSGISAIVYIPTSLYTMRYMRRYAHEYSLRSFAAWYLLLLASITALFVCRDVISFFLAWEIVAISASALVAYEWRREQNAKAAFVMLAMSEAGTMAAVVAMLLARSASGSLSFGAPGVEMSTATAWIVFLLSFFGFGVKAGILPVNSWLPRAHPVAPGSISALLSGIILNLGFYGIVLVNLQLVPTRFAGEGVIVLFVGAASALIGILYATIEDDLKTMLAYSSVENLGIAVTALGAALVFTAEHLAVFAAIAFAAAIYHVANHASYKALLFLGAATIDTTLGTRSMNRLGGVIRILPATATAFFIGVLAIAAIPPLNGFASEWLTLQALLRSVALAPITLRVAFALCGAVLALTAALAVTCFVKVFGMTFLGRSRTPLRPIGTVSKMMNLGMWLLAIECILLGVLPTYVLSVISRGAGDLFGPTAVVGALVPPFFSPHTGPTPLGSDFLATFHALGAQIGMMIPGRGWVVMLRGGAANPVVFAMSTTYLVFIIGAFLALSYAIVRFVTRHQETSTTAPWSGGVLPLLPEMTYTATGFSNPVRVIFDAIFHPARVRDERETIYEHFRSAIRRTRDDTFFADRMLMLPLTRGTQRIADYLARMHHGRLPAYVGYALATLVICLTAIVFM